MLDQRTLAERSAALELQLVREELMADGEELVKDGCSKLEVLEAFCEQLEERLTWLYRELYEIEEG